MDASLFEAIPPWLVPGATLVAILFGIWIIFGFTKSYLVHIALFFSRRVSRLWGRQLVDQKVLSRLVFVLPVALFMVTSRLVDDVPVIATLLIERISLATILILLVRAISAFLDNLDQAYSTLEISKNRPIKGFIQVFLLILYLLTIILVISVLIDKSPWIFISGLGAMTAVLLLVFRDTLLSLVAGLQLTSNNFISVGDWIEMPQFDADGDVIDIALHAVRVRNWDNTITVIPTHKFLEHSFKNWRGMEESGGRRIKRSLHIDMSSIKFLTDAEVEKLKKFVLLQNYIKSKLAELKEHNAQYDQDPQLIVNSRRLTNVGTFRAYLVEYLKQHPKISQEMTFLVRQLEPTVTGLPIEIYVFTNDTRWAVYESVQSDVFDHVIAITGEFGLRVFQSPTGTDFKDAIRKSGSP